MSAARFLLEGRVQGVFFRAATRAEAQRLGLVGYAQNLPDGRVEVLAAGSDAALDALQRWLRHGSPLARVDRLQRSAADGPSADGFQVL
ncbi:MAG TPA: acylphosphatase [Rhodanobacteraceae bacterium]|nr:acylphosphatase [Rhodanobacteraceae bacterium]